jgi:pheromone shutdown protein TraB
MRHYAKPGDQSRQKDGDGHMEQDLTRLTIEGREIVLVGTAHVSRGSVDEVRNAISIEKPDRVCVELVCCPRSTRP